MKYATLIWTLVIITENLFAQVHFKHAVFGELGGNAYSYSINYERQSPKGLTLRGGVSYDLNIFVAPVMVGKIYGGGQHHFEIGVGIDLVYSRFKMMGSTREHHGGFVTAFMGYRYQRVDRRFFWRAGFTPIWNAEPNYFLDHSLRFFPWLGAGSGYRFYKFRRY